MNSLYYGRLVNVFGHIIGRPHSNTRERERRGCEVGIRYAPKDIYTSIHRCSSTEFATMHAVQCDVGEITRYWAVCGWPYFDWCCYCQELRKWSKLFDEHINYKLANTQSTEEAETDLCSCSLLVVYLRFICIQIIIRSGICTFNE